METEQECHLFIFHAKGAGVKRDEMGFGSRRLRGVCIKPHAFLPEQVN